MRRSGIPPSSSGSSLHGHEFREILDTAFQAQSDMPLRQTETIGKQNWRHSILYLYMLHNFLRNVAVCLFVFWADAIICDNMRFVASAISFCYIHSFILFISINWVIDSSLIYLFNVYLLHILPMALLLIKEPCQRLSFQKCLTKPFDFQTATRYLLTRTATKPYNCQRMQPQT